MNSLFHTYGRGLSLLFALLTAAWVIGLIIFPQLKMIERSLIYEDRGDALSQLSTHIDRLYADLDTLRYEQSALSRTNTAEDRAHIEPLEKQQATLEEQITALEHEEQLLKEQKAQTGRFSFHNYTSMNQVHFEIFWKTLLYSFSVTVLCFLACYPIAYAMTRVSKPALVALMMLGLIIPYSINELLRIFSWVMILANQGILNHMLDWLGILDLSSGGVRFLSSNGSVFVVMMYTYILFMIFPIYNTLETLDENQIEAARDLGAPSWRIHWRIVLPHSKPGIAIGSIMTFMLSAGSISVPSIVGRGLHPDWFSQVIYRRFFESSNWNIGSAYSLTLLLACLLFILIVMLIFRVNIREIAK